jgi:hypothetical protein
MRLVVPITCDFAVVIIERGMAVAIPIGVVPNAIHPVIPILPILPVLPILRAVLRRGYIACASKKDR